MNSNFFSQYRIATLFVLVFLSVLIYCSSVEARQVKNIRYYRVSDDRIVIYYDLYSTGSSTISLEASRVDGENVTLKPHNLSGDVGNDVTAGEYKRIVWDLDSTIEMVPEDLFISVLAAVPPKTTEFTDDEEKKIITAYAIHSPIKIDGLLNEPSWENAVPAADFTQRELVEGVPPSEDTEVKILYDQDNLYIGIMCFDKEPDKIIHTEMRRDGELINDDNFTMILDTFNDKRSGFLFRINPNGARLDGKITGSRRFINDDWNGIWDVSARITDQGWSAEMFIPFKTLRFSQAEIQNWGINFRREIARKKEELLWCSWRRNDGIMQLSKAGTIVGLKDVKRGKQIEFKPYTLGGLENDENEMKRNFKYGLDAKYPLTSDLTLDFTTFTDFAQIEDDRRRINLTRFSLYYPEKRDFFLEGQEIFSFGSRYTSPFYSRKIGIIPDEGQVSILGGAKLTGKAGSYDLGILNMQTDEKNGYPSTNYSVVRVKKDLFERSYIGFIATNLYDTDKHNSQTYGADFSFNTDKFLSNKNLSISAYLADNKTPGIHHGTRAGSFSIRYPNDVISSFFYYNVVGENYEPEIGYVRRNGIKQYFGQFRYSPRPGIPFVRNLEFMPYGLHYTTDINNTLLTRSVEISPFGFTTTTDEEFTFNIKQSYEYLDEEFDIFNDVVIPTGVYKWWNYETGFRSNPSRPVSVELRSEWGDFYNGERKVFDVVCNFALSKHFAFSTDATYNKISIGTRSFETKEYGGRVNINISPRLTSLTFVQWNNETKEVNMNFRIHFIPQIGSDFYFVYNHLWDGEQNYKTTHNIGMSKIAYLVRF